MIAECGYNFTFPHDCKQGELLNDPNIAYMQCRSTPLIMDTETNAVINMICYSTEDIWDKAMAQGCAMGNVAPLVGHNAFLRKSALDKAAGRGNIFDGRPWSEAHVSEDFELMMRYVEQHSCLKHYHS
jgi:Glycosyl transferase family group 2